MSLKPAFWAAVATALLFGICIGWFTACADPTGPASVGLSDVALSGQVVDQFSGQPVQGVTVKFQKKSDVTDAQGRFEIPGSTTNRPRPVTFASPKITNRKAYARSGDQVWKVLPPDFNMAAFDDIGRSFSGSSTIRWRTAPKVYIDTNRYCFKGGDPQQWAKESEVQARAFVSAWMAGTDTPQVVVTASPPKDFTTGAIIVRFSECSEHVGQFIGRAKVIWNRPGEIYTGIVYMRAFKYRNDPGKRQGILGHELGHTMGFHHMFEKVPSLMDPSLGGKTDLLAFDRDAARFHYGRVPRNVAPDTDSKYSKSLALAAGGYWEGW